MSHYNTPPDYHNDRLALMTLVKEVRFRPSSGHQESVQQNYHRARPRGLAGPPHKGPEKTRPQKDKVVIKPSFWVRSGCMCVGGLTLLTPFRELWGRRHLLLDDAATAAAAAASAATSGEPGPQPGPGAAGAHT
jgi:hypothetical protein